MNASKAPRRAQVPRLIATFLTGLGSSACGGHHEEFSTQIDLPFFGHLWR